MKNSSQIPQELSEVVALTNLQLTVSDAREFFGGCIPGWQQFASTYGYEWKHVVRYGLSAAELLHTGDAMAINLVIYVYKREGLL